MRRPVVLALGTLLATCVAGFCAFVALALVADNPGTLIFARLPGVLALLAFADTATGAAIAAIRGLQTFTRR